MGDLLDRVRKLLRLAGSPNVHEAAQAAGRAQALIARHRLEAFITASEEADRDPDPITDGREEPLEVARRTRKWKIALASTLADAEGCFAWVEDRRDDPSEARQAGVSTIWCEAICVAGRSRDRELVRALWADLAPRIEWLSATAGPGRDRAWHEAFRIGTVDAIGERLAAGTGEARSDLGDGALAVIDPREAAHRDALDRFLAERFGKGKSRSLRVDARAYERGRAAGTDLPLRR